MLENLVEEANFADVGIIITASLAIVGFWRGVRGLMDIYLFPGNPTLSLFTSITIGLIILLGIALYRGKKPKAKKVK